MSEDQRKRKLDLVEQFRIQMIDAINLLADEFIKNNTLIETNQSIILIQQEKRIQANEVKIRQFDQKLNGQERILRQRQELYESRNRNITEIENKIRELRQIYETQKKEIQK